MTINQNAPGGRREYSVSLASRAFSGYCEARENGVGAKKESLSSVQVRVVPFFSSFFEIRNRRRFSRTRTKWEGMQLNNATLDRL